MEFSTRPADDNDESFLAVLYASAHAEEWAQWGMAPAQLQMLANLQFKAQQQHYSLAYPDAEHLIIRRDQQAIGRLLVHRSALEIILVDIALLAEFRGSGIGGILIKGLQEEAARAGKLLTLHVEKQNRAARLYERLGFRITKDLGVYWQMEWTSAAGVIPTEED